MQDFGIVASKNRKIAYLLSLIAIIPLRVPSLIFFGMIGLMMTLSLGWLLEVPSITRFFSRLCSSQNTIPAWLDVPSVEHPLWLYLPTLVFVSLIVIVTRKSPFPQVWSRTIVIAVLMGLTVRYLLWRSLASLNLFNPVDGIFSLLFLLTELTLLSGSLLQVFLNLGWKERHHQADHYSQAVISGTYQPGVAILIPTYNEPDFILRKTVIGCQAIDYANKQIYILDDTQRPEIEQLAKTLGCHYITRPDNHHAKAGNLNHALGKTKGELIAVFDADFIPTRNFLTRTVGFFQKPKMGIVQTCQGFYNEDAIAYNLGLEGQLNREDDFFHYYIQPIRDGADSVVCAGSSFVISRQILEEVGGFNTESLSEDYYTGLNLLSKGYQVIYLNEKLSAGLAAENIPAYLLQKARWGQGTLQSLLFLKYNIFNFPNLSLRQKLVNINGLLYWLANIPQSIIMIMPLLYTFFDIRPLIISPQEIIYFFLPYYVIHLISFYWLNGRTRTTIMSEIYNYVKIFPIVGTIFQTFINPFGKGFKITPKGVLQQQGSFYWKLALPILLLWFLNLITFAKNLIDFTDLESDLINLGFIWSLYNLIILTVSLIALRERPKLNYHQWFNLKEKVKLGDAILATTEQISEEGIMIKLKSPESYHVGQKITCQFLSHNLTIMTKITRIIPADTHEEIKLSFMSIDLDQYRKLVEILFCSPSRWQHQTVPGELSTLGLLLKLLVRPLIELRHFKGLIKT